MKEFLLKKGRNKREERESERNKMRKNANNFPLLLAIINAKHFQ